MPIATPWSTPDVVGRLLRACRTWEDRQLVVGYFAARSGRSLGPVPSVERGIALRDLPRPLYVDPGSGGLATYYEIVLRRVYALDDAWLPRPGDHVVDVGANIGVFSSWADGLIGPSGTLVALEPNPEAAALLERNAGGGTVHRAACGEEEGELDFHYVPGKLSVGSFVERADRTETVAVPVRRLDDVLEGARDVDLLKIDVEGWEREVLSGASETLARSTRVVLEISGDDLPPSRDLLEAAGFSMVGTIEGMWGQHPAAAQIAFFARAA